MTANHNTLTGISSKKQSNVVFLLSAPRSGSTLLRLSLNAHNSIFAPPELHLLTYQSIRDWQNDLVDSKSILKEGLIQALSIAKNCSEDDSRRLISKLIEANVDIAYVYKALAQKPNSLIVDKTPSYGQTIDTLRRSEQLFHEPKYIFLYRHPLSVVSSFVNNGFHKMLGMQGDPLVEAEEMWLRINSNIISFLQTIPPNRRITISYEQFMLKQEQSIKEICQLLNISYDAKMCDPFQSKRNASELESKHLFIGDPGLRERKKVTPELAFEFERHKHHWLNFSNDTKALAKKLGYSESDFNGAPFLTTTNYFPSSESPQK